MFIVLHEVSVASDDGEQRRTTSIAFDHNVKTMSGFGYFRQRVADVIHSTALPTTPAFPSIMPAHPACILRGHPQTGGVGE